MEDQSLNSLRRINGVSAAFVVDPQHPAADGGVPEAQRALLGAVVAALSQASVDLDLGAFGETIIEGERGAVVAGALPNGRAAVVLADGKANLGMIRMELRKLRRHS